MTNLNWIHGGQKENILKLHKSRELFKINPLKIYKWKWRRNVREKAKVASKNNRMFVLNKRNNSIGF